MVSALGTAGAKARLGQLVVDAEAALAPFGEAAAILVAGAHFVAERHA
jgi:farnesyl diphosphate synthase